MTRVLPCSVISSANDVWTDKKAKCKPQENTVFTELRWVANVLCVERKQENWYDAMKYTTSVIKTHPADKWQLKDRYGCRRSNWSAPLHKFNIAFASLFEQNIIHQVNIRSFFGIINYNYFNRDIYYMFNTTVQLLRNFRMTECFCFGLPLSKSLCVPLYPIAFLQVSLILSFLLLPQNRKGTGVGCTKAG